MGDEELGETYTLVLNTSPQSSTFSPCHILSCKAWAEEVSGGALGPEIPALVTEMMDLVLFPKADVKLNLHYLLSKFKYFSFVLSWLTKFSSSDFDVTSQGPMLSRFCQLGVRFSTSLEHL